MILAMMIVYIVVLYLVFNVFKLVQPSTRNQIYVTLIGCAAIYCILLLINVFQPMSTDLRVLRAVIPLRTRMDGTVVEVAAKPNSPLKKGDLIFRVDPAPYQADVDRLEAMLAEATQQAKMLPQKLASAEANEQSARADLVDAQQQVKVLGTNLDAAKASVDKFAAQEKLAKEKYDRQKALIASNATSEDDLQESERSYRTAQASSIQAIAARDAAQVAFDAKIGDVNTIVIQAEEAVRQAVAARQNAKLALDSVINGENTTVARIRAELRSARIDLVDTRVVAPDDGIVTNLSLRPGQNIRATDGGVVTFVRDADFIIGATFDQPSLNQIKIGNAAEVAFDDLPGQTFQATVCRFNLGIPQGQVLSDGRLLDTTPESHGRFFIGLDVEGITNLSLPAGTAGAATVYTDQGKALVPVRKVFFRWYTWLNYMNTEMEVTAP